MRKLFCLFTLIPFILLSCEKSPVAQFHTDTLEPEVGYEVAFYNDSHNATRYEWDFGDGYISNEANPRHSFNATGTYEVKLTAISKSNLDDKASITLDVVIPTLLEIQVLEYYQEYAVPDASIILYPTLSDWEAQTNPIIEGFTDQNGIAVFAGLANADHYVDVWEQNHDNYSLEAEDPEFIHISEIIPHQINRFTAWVDYIPHAKGAMQGIHPMVIKKLERKAAGKVQPPFDPLGENWQDVYNRRVNK